MFKAKNLFVVILILALIPLTASATITRVIGMGGAGANYILKDAANPGIWPQLVAEYPNLAGGEFYAADGSWDFHKAYVNYKPGDPCVLKFELDNLMTPHYMMSPVFPDEAIGGYNRLNITYGRTLNDMLIGLTLNYAAKSYKETEGDNKADISYSTIGANLGLTALEKKLDLALGFETASWSDKQGSTTVNESDGAMALSFAGRYWYNVNERYDLIPTLRFATMKDGAKYGDDTEALTTTAFVLSVGNNWRPVEDMLSIFELGVQSVSEKAEAKYGGVSTDLTNSELDIYWRLGFESKIFGWLNGRFGAERSWAMGGLEWYYDDNTGLTEFPGKPDIGTSLTNLYLGATAHWNRLYLDLLVEPMFLHNGPYFVTGDETYGMFGRVSLKYDFNN
ncbi:MAG: hypothetical protein ACOZB3_03880 [Calditrichota bacterium]